MLDETMCLTFASEIKRPRFGDGPRAGYPRLAQRLLEDLRAAPGAGLCRGHLGDIVVVVSSTRMKIKFGAVMASMSSPG
jgi:hypothetical protein